MTETLDTFVGQAGIRTRLRTLAEAALLNGAPVPHLLLSAPPGMGKATLARSLAGSLGVPLHVVSTPADLVACFRRGGHGIAFVDRLHDAPRALVQQVLNVRGSGMLVTPAGAVAVRHLTIVCSTTAARRVSPDLYHRLLVPAWVPYTSDEMTEIVTTLVGRRPGLDLTPDMLVALGRAASATPRYAARLVEAAAALAAAELPVNLNAILDQAGFTVDGLTDDHFRYLALVRECQGAATPALLVAALCLPPEVVSDLERVLVGDGMIETTNGGRRLTGHGHRRLTEQRVA